MRPILIIILAFISTSATAQDQTVELPPECRLLPEHRPSADVAYQPGVDVHGKAVVPADLNASPMAVPDTVVVPLTIDLAQRLNNPPVSGAKFDANLGYLEIEKSGRVTHNGQDLTSQVYLLCGKQPVSADGQGAADVIKSGAVTGNPALKTEQIAVPKAKPVQPPLPLAKPKLGELIEGEEYREEGTHE